MLIYILIALAVIVAILAIVVATRQANFSVTRSGTIAAPPAAVFALVNDFHNWEKWSPWSKMDPTAKLTFDGAAAGLGAQYAWAGNAKVGAGSMEITESHPSERIRITLSFTKPMAATNLTEFTFKPYGNQTSVIWTMSGKNNFIGKAMHLLIDCDKMIGGNFEQGLANMNEVVGKK